MHAALSRGRGPVPAAPPFVGVLLRARHTIVENAEAIITALVERSHEEQQVQDDAIDVEQR